MAEPTLPVKLPPPTFAFVLEGGELLLEWHSGEGPDTRIVAFHWHPDEPPQCIDTRKNGQDLREGAEAAAFLAQLVGIGAC